MPFIQNCLQRMQFNLVVVWFPVIVIIPYILRRFQLYLYACFVPGPKSLFLFGNAHSLIGNTAAVLSQFKKWHSTFGSMYRYWVFNRLYIVIAEPKCLASLDRKLNGNFATYDCRLSYFGPALLVSPLTRLGRKCQTMKYILDKVSSYDGMESYRTYFDIIDLKIARYDVANENYLINDIQRCVLQMLLQTLLGSEEIVLCDKTNAYIRNIVSSLDMQSVKMYDFPLFHFNWFFNHIHFGIKNTGVKRIVHNNMKDIIEKFKSGSGMVIENTNKNALTDNLLSRIIESSYNMDMDRSHDEVTREINAYMLQESELITTMTCFVLLCLAINKDIQAKVHEEITRTISIDGCKYLDSVIKETLRLFPPIPVIFKEITSSIKLEPYIIPSGTTLMVPIILAHRDPNTWTNPTVFNPDRFLLDRDCLSDNAWIPFDDNGIGTPFTIRNVKILVAVLVKKYHFTTTYKSIDDVELHMNLYLKPVEGFQLLPILRQQ